MDQLSFFSVGVAEPTVADLGGLLAGQGQITLGAGDARLSVLVAERWRADALVEEFTVRDLAAEVRVADAQEILAFSGEPGTSSEGAGPQPQPEKPVFLVRTDRSAALVPLVGAWTRGAVKQLPGLPMAPGGFLRCWALASGRRDPAGYLLGLDPRAEQLHTRLASALSAVGMTGVLLGSRAGGPAVRIVGRRRLTRLAELLGDPPPGAPEDAFPPGR